MPFKGTKIRTLDEIAANPDPNDELEMGYAETLADMEAEKLLQKYPNTSPEQLGKILTAAANKLPRARQRNEQGQFAKTDDGMDIE